MRLVIHVYVEETNLTYEGLKEMEFYINFPTRERIMEEMERLCVYIGLGDAERS